MQMYNVTGFINGVWCTITIKTTYADSIVNKAMAKGMTEITNIEEVQDNE
jgi:coenzyme F420-reducing hydrogenase beta subunit